jgi:hypothetical protein
MRSIKTEGLLARSQAERVGVALAAHAVGDTCGELVEVVEVARELGEAADKAAQVFRPAEFRIVLSAMVDEGQTQHLAGALPDQHLHAVFGGGDVAFEPGAVFGVLFEVGDVDRVHHPAHHHLQPATHELTRPSDLVERKQEAQQDAEQLAHGQKSTAGSGAVSSGRDCPTDWARRALRDWEDSFFHPLNPEGVILHFGSNHGFPLPVARSVAVALVLRRTRSRAALLRMNA